MNFHLNDLNKWKKRGIAFASDISFTIISLLGAIWLSSTLLIEDLNIGTIASMSFLQGITYITCGLYRGVWRFASIPDLIRIIRAIVIGTCVNIIFLNLSGFNFPLKSYIIYALLLVSFISGSRLLFRWLREYHSYQSHGKRVLVVGAGSAGEGLMRDLYRSSLIYQYLPVAFVDDNPNRHGFELQGIRIVGYCKDIPQVVKKYNIELILIAIPSVNSSRMREIVSYCEESKVPFRTLPSLKDIANGSVKIDSLREVLLEDLLGREQVSLDWKAIKGAIQNKSILVTGGGGSIGSELCRQILRLDPKKLIIVDNNEYNLYSIDMELRKSIDVEIIQSHLCNVTDRIEIEKIFSKYIPDLVFHVAAYKHVPLLENHLRVAMYNNIIGTKTVAELSETYQVNTFVLISTDKAVNPTSIMGATKRASEVFCQTFNTRSRTRFITVRFGNVLDSAGSVIPLFRKQLMQGGPLTVTHPDISRYFMTISEASQLILQATIMDDEGEIFVLDMGNPINIRYLAEQMIKLSGKSIEHDIQIIFTGLRPGEKLHEELFHHNENICATSHPKIKQARIRIQEWDVLLELINDITVACQLYDEKQLEELLVKIVPEYQVCPDKKTTAPIDLISTARDQTFAYS